MVYEDEWRYRCPKGHVAVVKHVKCGDWSCKTCGIRFQKPVDWKVKTV